MRCTYAGVLRWRSKVNTFSKTLLRTSQRVAKHGLASLISRVNGRRTLSGRQPRIPLLLVLLGLCLHIAAAFIKVALVALLREIKGFQGDTLILLHLQRLFNALQLCVRDQVRVCIGSPGILQGMCFRNVQLRFPCECKPCRYST